MDSLTAVLSIKESMPWATLRVKGQTHLYITPCHSNNVTDSPLPSSPLPPTLSSLADYLRYLNNCRKIATWNKADVTWKAHVVWLYVRQWFATVRATKRRCGAAIDMSQVWRGYKSCDCAWRVVVNCWVEPCSRWCDECVQLHTAHLIIVLRAPLEFIHCQQCRNFVGRAVRKAGREGGQLGG